MNENQKIEYYLLALERVLGGVPTIRRAEIILNVKSRIEESIESGLAIEDVLKKLGPVDKLSTEYGVLFKPKSSRIVRFTKWLILISFLCFFVLTASVWWFFHHYFTGNENFVFHMNDESFNVEELNNFVPSQEDVLFEDVNNVQKLGIKKLEVKFSNGKVRYSTSSDGQLSWRCKLRSIDGTEATTIKDGIMTINLVESLATKCDIKIPESVDLVSKGGNGDVQVVEPYFNIDLKLANGKVEVKPAPQKDYIYDLEVVSGRIDEFVSSQDPKALTLKVRLTNGTITQN